MRIPAHSVCTAIRDDIVSGVYERGSRLTEELLARRYGVSRVPVREALRTLESEGFVVTRRHAGACVAEPTEQEAADLLEVRMLLEPLGAARAAQRRTEAHLKVLRGLVRLGQERARRGRGGSAVAGRLVPRDPRPGLRQPRPDRAAHPAPAQDRLDVRRRAAGPPGRLLGRARGDRGRGGARRRGAGQSADRPARGTGRRRPPAAPPGPHRPARGAAAPGEFFATRRKHRGCPALTMTPYTKRGNRRGLYSCCPNGQCLAMRRRQE